MSAQHTPALLSAPFYADLSPARLRFLRSELANAERQAAFNRAHYTEPEAATWDVLAAEYRAAIAKATGAAS